MNPVVSIAKKRDGGELSREEIAAFIGGFATEQIPDYQMAALAMAIYLRGMTTAETAALTDEMLASGQVLQWQKDVSEVGLEVQPARPVVDKHSTGGVGDKSSLILAPLLACCGLRVPMLSGRGLGATGGTLDKLEAIPGYRTNLEMDEIRAVVERVGCVITGASRELAPADRKLYALRDVTATVPSIPLITASIMSKKLAEGLDSLVLDVKWGSGAFMKSAEDAETLARSLVNTGQRMNVKTVALLTDMNQPLGQMCGNALEVKESLDCLRGEGPADLWQVTQALAIELLLLTGKANSHEEAVAIIDGHIRSGRAYDKFAEMVAAQGGNLNAPRPIAPASEVLSEQTGYVATIDTEQLGLAIIELGGGRKMMSDKIDFSTGLEMLVRIGERVERGQPLVRLFAHGRQREVAGRMMQKAIRVLVEPIHAPQTIVKRIVGD